MARSQIKSKVVKSTLANKDVLSMFHDVLGTSEGSTSLMVTHPKYLRMRGHAERFLRLLGVLCESNLMQLFPGPREHLGAYVAALQAQLAESFCAPDLDAYLPAARRLPSGAGGPPQEPPPSAGDYAKIPAEVIAQFGTAYGDAKKCSLVNTIVVTCKNLVAHKKSIQDPAALKDHFLRGAGTTFCPLPDLPQVNFKHIYGDGRLTPENREFILAVLHKCYAIGHDVYEVVSSPDVDVNEFVDVIMSSIEDVKKHIPRCDQAFQKIAESVDLLRGNFGDYYKDYVASNNPTIIMENFVLDVSKGTESSPKVTAQFRRIISHYRKLASQQATNPKLQSIFQQVDKNFQELESKSQAADGADPDPDVDDLDPQDDEGPRDPKVDDLPVTRALPGAGQSAGAAAAADPVSSKTARNRRKKAKARARGRAGAAPQHDCHQDPCCSAGGPVLQHAKGQHAEAAADGEGLAEELDREGARACLD